MTTPATDLQAVIDVAKEAAGAEELELGGYHVVPTADGIERIDLTGEQYRRAAGLAPVGKVGTVTVRDVPSFVTYFAKHASPDAEIFADRDNARVVAVLDAHTPAGGEPQWQAHRVVLALRYSEQFDAWRQVSGKLIGQSAFAEFIEDHRADIRDPDAATVLELAQTFQATTKVSFKSGFRLKDGQRQLTYVESIDAQAGQRGDIAIPDALQLALPVYDGAQVADHVTARLRYRIDGDGRLGIGVVLDQLPDVVRAAFEGVIAEITVGGVTVPILRGTPA